jgi:mono/diheme cytochrome c family protein
MTAPAATCWVTALAWCVAFGASALARQAGDAPAPKPASTGVYAADQATRGKDVFSSLCTGCHTAASQSGEPFAKRWKGALVADLYIVLSEQMPQDDPGSLTPKERIDVIAYLLKLNDLPEGKDALPSDPELLKKIVIDLK